MAHVLQALRSLVEHQQEGLEDGAVPVAPVAARSGHHPVNDLAEFQSLEERCRCQEASPGRLDRICHPGKLRQACELFLEASPERFDPDLHPDRTFV